MERRGIPAGGVAAAAVGGAAWLCFGTRSSTKVRGGTFGHYPFDPVAAENFQQKLFIPLVSPNADGPFGVLDGAGPLAIRATAASFPLLPDPASQAPSPFLLMEPAGWRRRGLTAFVAAGAAVSVYLLILLVAFPAVSRPTGQHIEYVSPHFFATLTMTLYLLSTAVSPMLSTHRMVVVFGSLALLSFGAAYAFYATWFISVWCFFAALLSAVIYFHISQFWRVRFALAATRAQVVT